MIDPDAHEAVVGGKIVYAVRNGLADGVRWKVVHVHQLGLSLWLPLAPCIFEVADQLLLLRINGNNWDSARHAALSLLR